MQQKVFLITGFQNWGKTFIIENLLPKECVKISFPNLYFEGYHIENYSDHSSWDSVIKFPNGNKTINKFVKEITVDRKLVSNDIEQIIERLNDVDLYSADEIDSGCKNSIQKLQQKEAECDVQISNLILENFKNYYLFFTPNHPSKFIIHYVVGKILAMIGYEFDPSLVISIDWFSHSKVPISPCLIKHYNLNFWGDQEPMYNLRIGSSVNVNWRRTYTFTHDDYWSLYIGFTFSELISRDKYQFSL